MKTHDELVAMTEEERTAYLKAETDKILDSVPPGPLRNRLKGLQWELNILKETKYKDDPTGYLVEISTRMVRNLSTMQDNLGELKNILESKKLD